MSAWGGCAGAGEKHAHRGSRFTARTACRRAGRIRSCARRCTRDPWLERCPRVTQASRIRAYPMDHRRLSHAMLPLKGIGRSDGLPDTGKRSRMRWVGVPHRRPMAVLSCSRVVSLFFSDSRQDGSLGHTGRRSRLRIYSTGSRAPLALNFCMPLRAADLTWPSARRARPAPAGTRVVATGIRVEAMALT
jgi:hypothetical protein